MRQKLLSLIGRIGREARSETTTGKVRCRASLTATAEPKGQTSRSPRGFRRGDPSVFFLPAGAQVLEVLWELAHLPTLPTSLVQQALEEHLGILSDAYAVKEAVKRNYIIKCIEDIKKVSRPTPRPRCLCGPCSGIGPERGLGFISRGGEHLVFSVLTVLLVCVSSLQLLLLLHVAIQHGFVCIPLGRKQPGLVG